MRWLLYLSVALTVFTVFVTVFAASAESSRVRALPKWAWVLLCILTTPIGGILYLFIGRPTSAVPAASQQKFSPNVAPRPYGRAPEDDPEFMRELERRLREQRGDDGDK
jgi:hypothetical protein